MKREVKWSWRCTPQEEEIGVHYDGDYKVEVCDQDGDNYLWTLYKRDGNEVETLAYGNLPVVGDLSYEELMSATQSIALFTLGLFKNGRRAPRRSLTKGT